MNITPQFVLEGFVDCLLTARRRQADAILLYRANRFPSAYILGTIAAEHVGRAIWLQKQWLRLRQDRSLSVPFNTFKEELRSKEHIHMLTEGTISTSIQIAPELTKSWQQDDSHEYMRKLRKQINLIWKRRPQTVHKTRMQAQYVSPSDSGATWRSPEQLTDAETKSFLNDVGNNFRALLATTIGIPEVAALVESRGIRTYLMDATDIWPTPVTH